MENRSTLTFKQKILLYAGSLLLVGFGQPAFSVLCSIIAALLGFALFWRILLDYPSRKARFWLSTAWFMGVQLIQLSWMMSHPYIYIYGVYGGAALFMGLQFGFIGMLIRPSLFNTFGALLSVAGLWTLLEWSRLFIFSGFPFDPVGLALSAHLYSLQFASVGGIYGLSFLVILTNLLALRAWLQGWRHVPMWGCAALLPFLYGTVQLHLHQEPFNDHKKTFSALLVQTAFPVEETLGFKDQKKMVSYVLNEWRQILLLTKPHLGQQVDLVALPEFTVPYGTYSCVYPYFAVKAAFAEIFGPECLKKLPLPEQPLGMEVKTSLGPVTMVDNAFWAQALANIFNAEVMAGLEDVEQISLGKTEYYSAAMHFTPKVKSDEEFTVDRYEKRVLVPMGEYIPFSIFKKLAESYGIYGSFTCGSEAKVFGHKMPMGLSICYEEMFGNMMRESRTNGAELFVNLTSDVWYPKSRLSQQHFDHARLRTVESGIPLIRACNTGITGAIDSLGRLIGTLEECDKNSQWIAGALKVEVPTYHYHTLYTRLGDGLIIGFSLLMIILFLRFSHFI